MHVIIYSLGQFLCSAPHLPDIVPQCTHRGYLDQSDILCHLRQFPLDTPPDQYGSINYNLKQREGKQRVVTEFYGDPSEKATENNKFKKSIRE